jgi:hypothetical protein
MKKLIKAHANGAYMDEIVKNDASKILNRLVEILKTREEKDIIELNRLSNHTIHNASVFQDEISVSLAVLIYSLSKIIQRNPLNLNYNKILKLSMAARKQLKENHESEYNMTIKRLFSEISDIDSKLRLYVQEVINQAQIKKGSKLCEHGLTCAKASSILGISQWELMNYIGKTKLNEYILEVIDVRSRLNFARGLFT